MQKNEIWNKAVHMSPHKYVFGVLLFFLFDRLPMILRHIPLILENNFFSEIKDMKKVIKLDATMQ